MVYDKIDNLQQYLRLSEDIAVALRYLQSLGKDVVNGAYQINENVKSIVCEYSTKVVNENDFEDHENTLTYIFLWLERRKYLVYLWRKLC